MCLRTAWCLVSYMYLQGGVTNACTVCHVIISWCVIGTAAKEILLETLITWSQLPKNLHWILCGCVKFYIMLYTCIDHQNYASLTKTSDLDHWLSTNLHPYSLTFTLTAVTDHPTVIVCLWHPFYLPTQHDSYLHNSNINKRGIYDEHTTWSLCSVFRKYDHFSDTISEC